MKEIKRLFKLITKYKLRIFFGIIFMLLFALFNVAPAYYMKPVIDSLSSGKIPELRRFYLVALAIILLFFLKGTAFFGQNYLMHSLGQRLILDLRKILFQKILILPIAFYNKKSTGDLISRFTTDLNVLDQAIYVAITGPLRDLPQIFILLYLMFFRSWQLFFVTIFLLPIAAFLITLFGRQNKKITIRRQNKYGDLTTLLTEAITGIRVIKAFCMEEHEIKKFEKENNRLLNYFLKSIRIGSYSSPVLEIIGASCGAVILTYGGYLIINGIITGGDFASFIVSFFMLNDPIKKFNGFTQKLQEGLAASGRIFEILDIKNIIIDKKNAQALPPIKNNIQIKIHQFGYAKKNVLKDIDIELEHGKVTALVGSSGSGKTTLSNLLPRFYDIPDNNGFIKIDGINIKDVTQQSLRDQIAMVTQETILFNDTILKNICYGNINCPEHKVIEAAKAAYAHDFICQLPNQYNQQIGEKGVNLSGGQRQRLAIARALIKDAPILILDEATSALDTESEQEVQKAIENLMRSRTTLVIAHRLSTIQYADIIHVMKDGEIIESGTHKELLDHKGEYCRFYEMQFK